ncbi:MAG: choice-of-anchor D domain-containing protein [Candidatus Coatesbacteria bacterium]|nr:choice-of-anchor D domain-containing protein [Candidatus Coatesbacteria bacterium]
MKIKMAMKIVWVVLAFTIVLPSLSLGEGLSESDGRDILDQSPPETSCSVSAEFTSAATISVQYSSIDDDSGVAVVQLFASIDGAKWKDTGLESDIAEGEFVYSFSGGDATYRFVAIGTDNDGNKEKISDDRACAVGYDTDPPVSRCNSPDASNDAELSIDYEISDSFSDGEGVMLYFCFTEDNGTTTAVAKEWEYVGDYQYGPAGTIDYTPEGGAGNYEFFTRGYDRAGNVESMKDTADCRTAYDPGYALSSCWTPPKASGATLSVSYVVDIGDAGFDHVELWLIFSLEGITWPEDWFNSGIVSFATESSLIFNTSFGDGYYRFSTVAYNGDGDEEPLPNAYDCETVVDASKPASSVLGPGVTATLPVNISYQSSDQHQEGRFFSGVVASEVWYSFEGQSAILERIECSPATIATGTVEFTYSDEGVYELWSIGTDAFGNQEPTPLVPDMQLAVDLTPPESKVESPQYATSFPLMLTAIATDAVTAVTRISLFCSLDGDMWLPIGDIEGPRGAKGFAPEVATEGVFSFISVATDRAGHQELMGGDPDCETMVDWTSPEALIMAPEFASSDTITIDYAASDNLSGVAEVTLFHLEPGSDKWSQAGFASFGASGTFTYSFEGGQGEYGFAAVGRDVAGNSAGVPLAAQTTIIFDSESPESEASCNPYSDSLSVNVSYSASDETSGITSVGLWYRMDDGEWLNSGQLRSTADGKFLFQAKGDGEYQFSTISVDGAGNMEALPDSADCTTVIDTVRPSSTCESPEMLTSFPIQVTFAASDEMSGVDSVELWYRFDGGTWKYSSLKSEAETGSFEFSPRFAEDGYYEFTTRAYDRAGNVEPLPDEAKAGTLLDSLAPISTCSCPDEANSFPIAVTYYVNEELSGLDCVYLWYRYADGEWSNSGLVSGLSEGIFEFTPEIPQEGTYGFATIGRDVAGNEEALLDAPDCEIDVIFRAPSIYAEPTSIEFGEVRIGLTVSETVTIGNKGNADLEVYSIEEDAVGFSVDLGDIELPLTIQPDDPISVEVSFIAASVSNYSGVLEIISNDPNDPVLQVEMLATGREASGLSLTAATDEDGYLFGDTFDITVAAENDGDALTADIYLVLAYDFGGPNATYWSAVGFDTWEPGIMTWIPNLAIDADLYVEATLHDMPIPEFLLGQPREGEYTVLLGAFEPGTFDLISEIASANFELEADPYLEFILPHDEYSFGDTMSIGFSVSVNGSTLHGDVYMVIIDPVGEIWSVNGDLDWARGLSPLLEDTNIMAGTKAKMNDIWRFVLPREPFDNAGSYMFLAGVTEAGGFTPLCDLGISNLLIDE